MTLRTRMACMVILLLLGCVFAAPFYQNSVSTNDTSNDATLPKLQIQVSGRNQRASTSLRSTSLANATSVLKKSTSLHSNSSSPSFSPSTLDSSSPSANAQTHRFGAGGVGVGRATQSRTVTSRFENPRSSLGHPGTSRASGKPADHGSAASNRRFFHQPIPDLDIPQPTDRGDGVKSSTTTVQTRVEQAPRRTTPMLSTVGESVGSRYGHFQSRSQTSRFERPQVELSADDSKQTIFESSASAPSGGSHFSQFELPRLGADRRTTQFDQTSRVEETRSEQRQRSASFPAVGSAMSRSGPDPNKYALATDSAPTKNRGEHPKSAPPSRFESTTINWNQPRFASRIDDQNDSMRAESTIRDRHAASHSHSTLSPAPTEENSRSRQLTPHHERQALKPVSRSKAGGASTFHSVRQNAHGGTELLHPSDNVPGNKSTRASVSRRWHRISRYDTLAELSQKYYGTTEFALYIFEANRRSLVNPAILPIGLELIIPDRPKQARAMISRPSSELPPMSSTTPTTRLTPMKTNNKWRRQENQDYPSRY